MGKWGKGELAWAPFRTQDPQQKEEGFGSFCPPYPETQQTWVKGEILWNER